MRWKQGSVLLVVALVGFLSSGRPAIGAPRGGGTGFHTPVVLPGSDGGNEPSLAISGGGTRYASWQAPGEFASSTDGVNFTNLGMPDDTALGDVSNAVDAAGSLYNSQICGDEFALHTCVYRSDDGGHTWPIKSEPADSNPGASDRPWIDVYPKQSSTPWDPNQTTVYLEYHTFSPEDLAYVTVSHDGGQTFGPPNFITTGTNAIVGSLCNTVPGGVIVDQKTGTVYALWLSGNDVVANGTSGCNYSQIGPFDKAWVSVSTDGGTTWAANLAWQGAYDSQSQTGDNADKIFATIAQDLAGQVHVALPVRHNDDPEGYVLACEQDPNTCQEDPQFTDLLIVTSPDKGAHWTAPYSARANDGSNFFPWIAAGSSGNLAILYYHTASQRPNDPTDNWYIDYAAVTKAVARVDGGVAHYVKTPHTVTLTLDPSVVHQGGICSFGIFCSAIPNANRDLADAISLAVDPAGGANGVWTKDAGTQGGGSEIDFACQSSGPSLYAGKPALKGCYKGSG